MLCSSRITIDVNIYIERIILNEHCLNENQSLMTNYYNKGKVLYRKKERKM
jgi:hypothetical protein